MKGTFQIWTPDGWKDAGRCTTAAGALRISRRLWAERYRWGGRRDPEGGPDYGMPQFLPDTGGPAWRVAPDGPVDDSEIDVEYDRRHRPAASGAERMAASS